MVIGRVRRPAGDDVEHVPVLRPVERVAVVLELADIGLVEPGEQRLHALGIDEGHVRVARPGVVDAEQVGDEEAAGPHAGDDRRPRRAGTPPGRMNGRA